MMGVRSGLVREGESAERLKTVISDASWMVLKGKEMSYETLTGTSALGNYSGSMRVERLQPSSLERVEFRQLPLAELQVRTKFLTRLENLSRDKG